MAYGRTASVPRGTWFQEQMNMVNNISKSEMDTLSDTFDTNFKDTVDAIKDRYGVDVRQDAKKMIERNGVFQEYKELMLKPICDELIESAEMVSDPIEKIHLESVADQLDKAWDASVDSFVIQEAYNTSTYLPLSTLDFPALVKQYIKFLGKEIIPVQTASSTSIEQRIFTKYLVNNQTGEEYEVPKVYFQKEEDGTPTWKKLWNAGKGYRINDKDVLTLAEIQKAPNKKYSMFNWLIDDNGDKLTIKPNIRTRLSYDFSIQYIQYNGKKVKLPGAGIAIDIQTGGTFLNGGITDNMKLPVVDEKTNMPTGETVSFADRLSGIVDFVKGTISASSCGEITGIYISGHISNETNMRTIGFREYPDIRKYNISDGCRFQLPFTVEDFQEANASLNFNLYNRLVQELVTNQEMFEDESILEFLEEDFTKYDGYDSDIWSLESYNHTEYVDLDPTSISPNFAGDPWEYRTNAIHNAINSVIYELCDRGKLDNLGFVIYANPKVARLLSKFTTWTVKNGTEIGGINVNYSSGVLTDSALPIRVVSSNRVDAYTVIPAYQDGATDGDMSREYIFKIVAYPMDKFHISYKHLRFARHLTNSPENAGYADVNNPGGQAVLVTTSSQYKTISVQGIQGRVICKNSRLVPDAKAGLIVTSDATGDTTTGEATPPVGGGVTGQGGLGG